MDDAIRESYPEFLDISIHLARSKADDKTDGNTLVLPWQVIQNLINTGCNEQILQKRLKSTQYEKFIFFQHKMLHFQTIIVTVSKSRRSLTARISNSGDISIDLELNIMKALKLFFQPQHPTYTFKHGLRHNVPPQAHPNNSLFHAVLRLSSDLNGRLMTSDPKCCQKDAALFRCHTVLHFHKRMRMQGGDLPDLSELHRQFELEYAVGRGADFAAAAGGGGAGGTDRLGSARHATTRSVDMDRCRLAVVLIPLPPPPSCRNTLSLENGAPAARNTASATRCQTLTRPKTVKDNGGATVTVSVDLFLEVVNTVANIPFNREIDDQLAASFGLLDAEQRPTLYTRSDIAAMKSSRNRNRLMATKDEQIRSRLLNEIVNYIACALNAVHAMTVVRNDRRSPPIAVFSTVLTDWVRSKLLKVKLPLEICSPIMAALETRDAAGEATVSSLAAVHRQQRVPVEGGSFDKFQHMPDRCGRCADDCNPQMLRLECSCGAICCLKCYGLKASDVSSIKGYRCDTCRAEHGESAVVFQWKNTKNCSTCRMPLEPSPSIHLSCPECHCKVCQRCAALACSEGGKSSTGCILEQRCLTCAGMEEYQRDRTKVCIRLLTHVLGPYFEQAQSASITVNRLTKGKQSANELGDLMYDCFYNGYHDVFDKFFQPFMQLVMAQLAQKQLPSVDPFHLLYYMGQHSQCSSYLLARVCRAQAEEALENSKQLMSGQATEPLPVERPSILRVGIYGSDLLQCSPTADLLYSVMTHWHDSQVRDGRHEFFLFADGPVDRTHAPAEDIAGLFAGRLELFTEKMTAKKKCDKIIEKRLHVLVTLTGWTHGHIAEVIAAVAGGPVPLAVFNWLGWAGLMNMKEAVHFTIVGSRTLSDRQRSEWEEYRERVAVVPSYQPAQSHLSQAVGPKTRDVFNLPPSQDVFLWVFTGTVNRIVEATFMMWLGILARVNRSCLLLLSKPLGKRKAIYTWIQKYNESAARPFDVSRIIWRPMQNKPHFLAMLHAAGEHGAALDSVDPIGIHTTASDAFAQGLAVLSYQNENGFQSRVAWELAAELGLEKQCVATSRAEFEELAVQYALNRPQQRAIRQYVIRICIDRAQNRLLAKQLLQVIEHGHDMCKKVGFDHTKLKDFNLFENIPPVFCFEDSPEYATYLAEAESPDASKRKELLARMLAMGLSSNMVAPALQVMEAHQKQGLRLESVVGAGSSTIVISAITELHFDSCVEAGKKVVLKLSKEGQREDGIKNHSLSREGIAIVLVEKRLERQEFAGLIPAPACIWSGRKNGRCFWGHTSPDCQGLSMIFLVQEHINVCFDDCIKPFGEAWRRDGVLEERFQYEVLRPLFRLAFELEHTAGIAAMDIKPHNMGRRETGQLVIWDLGYSIVYPKPDDSDVFSNALPTQAGVGTGLSKGPAIRGTVDKGSGLSLVSYQQVTEFCRRLKGESRGLVRLGSGTYSYKDQRLPQGLLAPELAFAHDRYAFGRSLLKRLCYDSNERLEDWEARACLAAEQGQAGIRQMLMDSVDPRVHVRQVVTVDRLCDLLAGVLNPDPKARMDSKKALLHAANTLPSFSPEHSVALRNGDGILMAGGLVESMPVPFQQHPDLKEKSIPPVWLQLQGKMGVGVKLGRSLKKGDIAALYGGKFVDGTDTGQLRRAFPSRYSVSNRAARRFPHVDSFICDAAPDADRPIRWFVENSNSGPFMNGMDGEGVDINCDLDRHSAWLDNQGNVWYLLKANRDIREGEWLMWSYKWRAGAGIAIPGLTFQFD